MITNIATGVKTRSVKKRYLMVSRRWDESVRMRSGRGLGAVHDLDLVGDTPETVVNTNSSDLCTNVLKTLYT